MKKLITLSLLAFTLIGCNKQEQPEETKVQAQGATTEMFMFKSYGIGQVRFDLYDGSTLLSSGFNDVANCNHVEYDLTEGINYRMVCREKGSNNDFQIVACEYSMNYANGVLTTTKSNGSYNMFWADDCGYFSYTVK